jgi:hypothetical protein
VSTPDIAVIALGVNGLASTGALVYVVRRVCPWPKPPPQAPGSGPSRSRTVQTPVADGLDAARRAARRAGLEAWQIRQQQQEES